MEMKEILGIVLIYIGFNHILTTLNRGNYFYIRRLIYKWAADKLKNEKLIFILYFSIGIIHIIIGIILIFL